MRPRQDTFRINPTSTATLEETLLHEHMENGIQRILAKLDVVMVENFSNFSNIKRRGHPTSFYF